MSDRWNALLDGERDSDLVHLYDEYYSATGVFEPVAHEETNPFCSCPACLAGYIEHGILRCPDKEIEMTDLEQAPEIRIDDLVHVPGGSSLGKVVSQPYIDPNDGLETALVYQRGVGTIAYATSDLEVATAHNTSIGMILEQGSFNFTYVRLLELSKSEVSDLCVDGDVAEFLMRRYSALLVDTATFMDVWNSRRTVK